MLRSNINLVNFSQHLSLFVLLHVVVTVELSTTHVLIPQLRTFGNLVTKDRLEWN